MTFVLLAFLAGVQDPQEEPAPVRPPSPEGRRAKSPGEVKAQGGLDLTYNSNILRLSERDIDRLEDGTKPEKFRIEEPDDFIYSPWIEAAVAVPLFDEPGTAGLRAGGHFYATNSIASHPVIGAFFRQDPVGIQYSFGNDLYRREYRNLDTGEFESAFYDEHEVDADVRLRPLERLRLRPQAGLRFWDFEAPFNHRDAIRYELALRASVEVLDWLEPVIEYEFLLNDAFAETRQPDTSYRENGLELGFDVRPSKVVELGLRYRFADREYTTSNDPAFDPGHRGRSDDRREWAMRARWKVSRDIDLGAEIRRTDVENDLPNDPNVTDEESSWERTEVTGGITIRF